MTFTESANEVLKDKKYDILMKRTFNIYELIKEIVHNILKKISDLFNFDVPDLPNYNTSVIFNIFIIVTITLIIIIIGVIVYLIINRKRKIKTMDEIFKQLNNKSISLSDLLNSIKHFSEDGNFREAIRYSYISILWVLNLKNVIYIDQTKTGGQLKREIKMHAPQFTKAFSIIADTFNYIWFGHKKISYEKYETFSLEFTNLMKEVESYENKN